MKYQGVKKAVGDYNRFHRIDGGTIYINPEKLKIWYSEKPGRGEKIECYPVNIKNVALTADNILENAYKL